jgi:hypothetical protein
MAKKVRKKLEEEEAQAFEFPVFDEHAFIAKEFEMTYALAIAGLFAILLGLVGWTMSVVGLNGFIPFGVGLVLIAMSPFVIRTLRKKSSIYTKGDWAGLVALEFFGWLAMWFVLLNLSPHSL